MRNCKIATTEERVAMSPGGTVGVRGTGRDGIPLGKLGKVCPTLEIVGVAVGRSLRIDVSDGKQKGKKVLRQWGVTARFET